jgi:2-polyprenyl-3-methyl-5-hydroxy-6-metoxy-1,4-benzoquinol methylase
MHTGPLPATTQRVRDMYTRFPYPPSGPVDGNTPIPAVMDFTRHIFWPGRSDLSGLRVLDAGCGTGKTAVSIASQHPEMDVVGIDLSATSLEQARRLADSAGVGHNLHLRMLAIEDVGMLGLQFDYIIASGVIHHLESPELGLRALTDVLTPTGGIFLMLYATYGRAGVYMLQTAMRLLGGDADFPEQVALARPLLEDLPVEHPFNSRRWEDVGWQDDAGIVDLLLHVRDRSYTVPQVFDLIDGAGLRFSRFMERAAYDPATFLQRPELLRRFDRLDPRSRLQVGELLNGRICKHAVYATRATYAPWQPTPSGLVLLALRPRRSPLFNWSAVDVVGVEPHHQFRLTEYRLNDEYTREFDFSPWQMSVVGECDGVRTANEVFNLPRIRDVIPGENADAQLQRFGELLEVLPAGEVILCEI